MNQEWIKCWFLWPSFLIALCASSRCIVYLWLFAALSKQGKWCKHNRSLVNFSLSFIYIRNTSKHLLYCYPFQIFFCLQLVTGLSARLSFITDSAVWFMQFFSIIFIKFVTSSIFCKLQYYFVGHWICIFLVLLDVAHLVMKERLSAYLIHLSVSHNLLHKTCMCMGGCSLNEGYFYRWWIH